MCRMINQKIVFAITLFLTTFLMITVASAGDYDAGFVWRKADDYTAGTINNSTAGNPNLDKNGNPAWSYESFDKDLLNWDSSSLMVWRQNFRWVDAGDFVNISKWDQNVGLDTNWNTTGVDSLVRWTNPTGESIQVDMTGQLRNVWAGLDWVNGGWSSYYVASPSAVRVILGYHDFSQGTSTLLIDNTYASPISADTRCNTWAECPYIDTSLTRSISLDAGDSLFWTTIPLGGAPGKNRWITTTDASVRITLTAVVPEPVSAILLITGGMILTGRRLLKKM